MPTIETKAQANLARWYRDYAFQDGFGRNRIYNALVRKKVADKENIEVEHPAN